MPPRRGLQMGLLGASWGALGALLGALGPLLGPSWGPFGLIVEPLGGREMAQNIGGLLKFRVLAIFK